MTDSTPTIRKQRRMARVQTAESDTHDGAPGDTFCQIEHPSVGTPALPAKRTTKTDLLLDLLRSSEGATLAQMMAQTGWLAHTTRAALTGIKKKGHHLSSEKADGVRVYRIAPTGDA